MSPEVGVLDEQGFDAALAEDPDAALSLLVDLGAATDEKLRAAARRLAGKVVLDLSRRGTPTGSGMGRLRAVPADRGGDLDVEASMDAVLAGRAARLAPRADELTARTWARPQLALCVVVDRSGSMEGERLAAAALTAAACALRAPGACGVLAFGRDVEVLRPIGANRPPGEVVDAVLRLRGRGTTALAPALRGAERQLAAVRADRRIVVLLSDCRWTDDEDPRPVARRLPGLVVLAPAEDGEQAEAFAREVGARSAELAGPADAPAALRRVLADG
jgi:Mg-chelatase subunit ChlD